MWRKIWLSSKRFKDQRSLRRTLCRPRRLHSTNYSRCCDAALTAIRLAALRDKAEERRLSTVSAMKKEAPKFYFCLMKSLSVGSSVIIRKHADLGFEVTELASDPAALFAIIRSNHLTNVSGGGQEMLIHEGEIKEREFNSLEQTEAMDLNTFYKAYVEYRTMLTNMHVTAPTAAREAQKFLLKLDKKRHGPMLLQLQNAAITGTPYPQTLIDAYQLASCWKVEKLTSDTSTRHQAQQSSYVLADEADEPRKKKQRTDKPTGRGGRFGKGVGGGRSGGGRMSTRSDSKKKSASTTNVKAGPEGDMTGWVIPEGCEADSRTCRGCLKKGHIYPNCPDNPSNGGAGRVLVAVQGEETEDEEEGTEDRIFMINSDSNERVLLFAENEILLDNQASQAIFKNKNLLHNITSRVPYTMGGIDANHEGLTVARTGSIAGFSRIDGTIGLATNASANVLAQARLIDAGYKIEYDDTKDSYLVHADDEAMIFKRRLLQNGKRFPHYSYMSNATGKSFQERIARK